MIATVVKTNGASVNDDAPAYQLSAAGGRSPVDAGCVRFGIDASYFFARFDFDDEDIVAEGEADGLLHYELGDTAELFLKPTNETYYWEFYATPGGRWATLFWPGGGRRALPSSLNYIPKAKPELTVTLDGNLNDWHTRDRSWQATLRVPLLELEQHGAKLPGDWLVLASRYNYSRWLARPELTSFPALPVADFHRTSDYVPLEFA